ncbi:hypothetical protein IAR55_005632 [Kwoniella newhampshirensis]|uniref:Uncharacterized protein n=1 Tax=Kwoniella newhampshirensis TaxID=1651941 RepID=A0AAW0YY73_9TREE
MPPTPPPPSSSSTTLARPKSSSALPYARDSTFNRRSSQTQTQTQNQTQTQTQTQNLPLMIALSGWPEPVYVSTGKRSSRGGTPPPVYDGVSVTVHRRAARGGEGSDLAGNNNKYSRSTVVLPPHGIPSTSSRLEQNEEMSSDNHSRRQSTPSLTITNPSAASPPPTQSIFSSVCPHLTDPSLGPCPFPTHPHNLRGMFPPTSHLMKYPPDNRPHPHLQTQGHQSKGLSASTVSVTMTGQKGKDREPYSPKQFNERRSSGKEEFSPEEKDRIDMPPPPPPPIPSQNEARPSSPSFTQHQFIKQNYPSSSSASSTTSVKTRSSLRKGTFNDPRYLASSSILHKGRALPVVPSWSSPPPTPSQPISRVSPTADINVDEPESSRASESEARRSFESSAVDVEVKTGTKRDIRYGKGGRVLRATPEIYPLPSLNSNGTLSKGEERITQDKGTGNDRERGEDVRKAQNANEDEDEDEDKDEDEDERMELDVE